MTEDKHMSKSRQIVTVVQGDECGKRDECGERDECGKRDKWAELISQGRVGFGTEPSLHS